MQRAADLLPQFRAAVESGSPNAKTLLNELKLAMIEFPSQSGVGVSVPSEPEAALARDILELAVFFSVKAGDSGAFERAVTQLKQFYGQTSGINLGPSADVRRHVLGLYLLHLLVEARIGELHCEVEGLQPGDAASPFIAFPLALETYLMEGSYNKILAARASAPSPLYAAFMNRLTAAVRDDIADCAAAAYETLSVAAAQRMFKFESQREIVDYIAQQRPDWHVADGIISFSASRQSNQDAKAVSQGGVAGDVTQRLLSYALEIERII